MERITEKHLQAVVARLNRAMNRQMEPYTMVDGKMRANIGNFHLSHAYGGVCVQEMANESGGVNHACGMWAHETKRGCADKLHAALWAIEACKAA